MKVLITGAKGQLGSELVRLSPSTELEVHSVDHQQCNITDENRLKQVLENLSPDVVINAAAYTHVDGAESEPDRVFAVNKHGPAHLARYCAQNHRALIHISTDYVFDGSQNRPYRENDPVSPVGIYGHSKAQGEASVRSALKNHIIVRTSWLYGVYGHNFIKTILKLAVNEKKLRVVADQWGSPTSAADLAAAVLIIARKIGTHEDFEWGTYHYCGAGITTWHALAEKTLELATPYAELQTRRVKAISTAEWPTPVSRPPYSVLDCSRIKSQFGINPSPWQQSLKQVIERIYTAS